MKVFISVDMEGIEGLSSWSDMEGPSKAENYRLAQREVAWIVDELFASKEGPTISEICVCDSHARGEGIPYGGFGDARVTQVRGFPRMYYMLERLDESFDMAMLVGYHARIGTEAGLMDHSYSASCIYRVLLDKREVGEVEINATLAGVYGVPIALVSGDDALEAQLKEVFEPAPPFVRTKEGIGRYAAKMYAPERLEPEFRAAVRTALEVWPRLRSMRPAPRTVLRLDLSSTVVADAVSTIPGLVRVGGRAVEYRSRDFRDIYRMINCVAMLGGKFASFT
jgi:D-amino peptidase